MSEAPQGRRPRTVGVIALVLAVLLLIFVIASLSLDEGDEELVEITGADEVQRQLGGIPQDGAVLGSSEAPVSAQVFSDLQCAPCADYQRQVITPLIEGPVRDGDLRLEFHHFPMRQSGFANASYGAVAAAEQDDEWQFIQLFFINQDEATEGATDDFLDQIANAILNFNVEQWQRDSDDPEVKETLAADDVLSADHGFPQEPAVIVDGPRGSAELIESPSAEQIEAAIAQVR
ncbi:MAG: DsbA family protein [Solirubrobacterales bacterium]